MGKLLTEAMGNCLTTLMGNYLTEGMGKLLDIYNLVEHLSPAFRGHIAWFFFNDRRRGES